MQTQQVDEMAAATAVPPRVMGRLASAGLATAKWAMCFAISFALMAAFLILAHV